ncbi:PREDICTED: uncharacterized protein LOC108365490 [Rhagoletis zephyria]|uniref:uncharacterized protein LOC108365490 n=1 Tax=Rhagoletis zephyria TaxID=28612 RepID=UPI00081192DF|nr:PREDICTED: uncharacterized protein LOC108365490 [Rhagoletis zephyria]
MGLRYQDLKVRGDSIELERKESFTTERNHNGYIKRRKTILRERFARPNVKEVQKNHKQQPQRSATPTAQPPAAESGRNTTETIRNSPKSAAVVSTCRDRSHLERAVNRTSVQLKRLAHEIDNEIAKLKRERDKLMFRPRPYPLMRNAAIQNDIRVDEALPKLSLDQFNTIADNIEFTIEKFSSQHKFVCTSPRYARDEQTSCRPRMRTIGLQKDTRRSGIDCENFQNIKAKLDTAINYSATNLANLKATKGLLDPAPPNCYAFDYGGTGDGQKAMKVYHFQNCRCAGGFNQNESSCQKVCEHYNCVDKYNGTLCNKNTYVEKGVTPCSEYKYCRDEYRYDYPKQNNCVVPITNAPCIPCVPYQPCQPCVTYLPPCPTYSESKPAKPKKEVIYGRQPSDLNTNEFYHPTGASPRKRSPTKQHNARHSSNKERLTVDVPTDGRTFVDIERHGRTHSKSRRKKNDVEISKQRSFYQGSSPDKAMRQAHEHKSHGSADSSEKARQTKSNEKLLQITFTKERRHQNSLESGEEHMPYEVQASTREYSRETKRSMKKMTITAYKPCRQGESEGNSDEDRKKKQQRSKDRGGNSKYDDEKSWDERLRQTEDRPRLGDDWHVDVPTITEVYDNYRVGDAWIDEEDISATQPIGTLHVGGYRELIHIPQNRSYDIMPVPKDTVRDIPPIPSPNRGQRSKRDSEISHRLRGADTRGRPGSVTGQDPLLRTQRDYTNGMKPDSLRSRNTDLRERPVSVGPGGQPRTGSGYTNSTKSDSFTAYGLTEKPRLYEMDRSYAFGDDDSSSHRDYERRTPRGDILDSQQNAYKKYEPDGPANKVHESKVQPAAGNGFSLDNTSRSAPDFQCKPDRMHGRDHSVISTPGGKLHSARDYGLDSKLRTGKINEADSLPMGALPPTDSLKSESKATPGIMEQSDSIHSGKRGKREAYGPDSKLFEEENDATETASIIYRPRKGEKTETYVAPRISKTVNRTGKETESPREIPDSGQKFPTAMEVPEIKIEDLDDSGKSTRSGRYRGTDKLRQIEDHTEPGARVNGAPDTSSKPTTDSTTDKGGGRIHKSGAFDEQYGSGRKKGAAAPDRSQVLSPFPSLESPTIYMRPRETDYGSACLPSTSHCPKKTSPRVYCGQNAGDVYMCKSRQCSPQNVSPPSSPCRCLSPHRSGSEIPYEKLGDQYTHSPVRQLAATSHLAVALQTGKINEADSLPMGALPPTDSLKSESKATPGIMEQSDSIHSGKRGKREAYGPDSKLFEEENDATETASIIYRPRKGEKTETYVAPRISKTVNRTGKETESPREIPDSGQKFPTAMEVPEIKIEDLDDSGKSTRSGRYRGTDKLRQIEDHTEPGARVNGAPDTSSKPTTDSTTDKGGGRIDKSGAFDEQYGSGRKKGAAAPDRSQVLSPFPSLESPTIYMRPRETDYGSACLPSTSHCPKKTSPRVYCGQNAGDVYMCKSRQCSPQNVSPPSSPCRCLSPHRSGSEIPYEKLGDQYTHSPVRQLAANSHLAVALQPESATGYYIPSSQQQKSKSCLYLRSTGTQYSATIIENQDDRCAPQYVPLPKHCRQASVDEAKTSPSQASVDEAKTSPPHFPSACASPCQDFKLACDSESPQNNNNKFICDEGDEEYKGKANFSNDQFSDSEQTQIIVAQEPRQQQQKVYSKGADHKNFYLPWQQDKKFVPGQPMSDCTVTSWQDESQSSLKSTKYQNAADRRPPRFNTNLQPHQEMPEEEARCAQEILQYEPQSRAQFVEQSSRQDAVRDPCCDEREEEISFQNEAEESMHECTPRGRSEFDDCREYQAIPEFTGCPCMFKTYLNMIALYYPEYRTQISDSDSVIEDAEL